MRQEVEERDGGGLVVTVFLAVTVGAFWAALAGAALVLRGDVWLVWLGSCGALACAAAAAAAITARAARNSRRAIGPKPPQLPHARPRWTPAGPDRPTGQRPTSPVRYSCPVQPGWPSDAYRHATSWPRDVADLRQWPPPKRPDLRSWE